MTLQHLAFRSCEPMTQAEFARWLQTIPADDLRHYELLEGFVVMAPPAGWPHGEIEAEIVVRLKAAVPNRSGGRVFGSSQGFELPGGNTLEPDASFVSARRWRAVPRPIEGFPAVVPDLVVEILSPGTRRIDRTQKMRIYDRVSVREYWLIDPEAQSVCRFRRVRRAFDAGRSFAGEDVLVSTVLPGLQVPVAALFPEP